MPTYINISDKALPFPGMSGRVAPGVPFEVLKYAYPLSSNFELLSHEPRTHLPWEKLHAGVLPVEIEAGIAKFAQVKITNKSGAIATVIANDDTENSMVVLDGESTVIEHDHEIDALKIDGDGAGNVYVYGMRVQ
jgi:hypothetical protein